MKLLLGVLIILIPFQQAEPDLTVVKFTWSRQRQNDLIRSAQDPGPPMNEPISMPRSPARNEPAEVRNRRDIQERRAELAITEQNAVKSGAHDKQDLYTLHLEVKNVGPNTIKSMVWEFQPTAETADYDLRQYVCKVKAKPNESKTFDLVSPFSPVKVVSAEKKAQDGKVVINRIEYADGSVWKRKGWSVLIPPEMTDQMANGKCIVF